MTKLPAKADLRQGQLLLGRPRGMFISFH
jgi:hypothetical protein